MNSKFFSKLISFITHPSLSHELLISQLAHFRTTVCLKVSEKFGPSSTYFNQSQNSNEISTSGLFYTFYTLIILWLVEIVIKGQNFCSTGFLSDVRKLEVLDYKIFYNCTFMKYFLKYHVKMQVHENKKVLSKKVNPIRFS